MADWMKGFENQGTRYTIQINHKADQKWSAFGVFRPKSQAVVWFAVQKGMPRNDPGRRHGFQKFHRNRKMAVWIKGFEKQGSSPHSSP